MLKAGMVYLVGAGPGDPGLLTLKGAECLARADVVIYDHLLSEGLLKMAPSHAERIYAGKSSTRHTMEQDEINRLLVAKAKVGKTVVRLKGGDSFVFGRGGEEAEALATNRISFEIVPGVSAALAAPAYAGIPVTHRKMASSFAVITGHEDPRKAGSSIDWEKLATGVDTLVFLMGMQNLSEITARLKKFGRPPETPVAVIKDGTTPRQMTVTGNLDNIAERVRKSGLGPPAVIVVGKVAGLRNKLRWFDNRPLSGRRILVTRSREQAGALSKLLGQRGAVPVELPVIEIRPVTDFSTLDNAVSQLDRFQWIVFTSINGVEAFFSRLNHLGMDTRSLGGMKIAAIGPATVEALEQRGIKPEYCPAEYTSAALLTGFKKRAISGQRFLLPRADIADKDLTRGIRGMGGVVQDIACYHTGPASSSGKAAEILSKGEIDMVTFASSSTVTNLVRALKGKKSLLKKVKIACIGPVTAETAIQSGLRVDIIAPVHTIPGLVSAIEDYYAREV
ncbi:MAG: uroporphyrinogen-III C-methyltransferase [Dehalococcoidia bacterium]